MTTETRYRPWVCHHCGVLLDTVGVVRDADVVPEQVDLAVAICIGCLDGHAWRPLRVDELAALAPGEMAPGPRRGRDGVGCGALARH